MIVALDRPDYTTRLAVLEQLTSRSTVVLSEKIIACIAQNVKSNIREVELCFNLLITEAQLHKKEITLDFTIKVVRDLDTLVRKLSTMNLRDGYNKRIKIIGLGSEGCNIVNYLYNHRTGGVDFIVCDSDEEIIDSSTVPNKIRLKDQVAVDMAQPLDLRVNALYDAIVGSDTEVVLILIETAETTKALIASVIAQLAKERGVLSVGLVSIPLFTEEKENLLDIEKLCRQFDALVVIDNNKSKEPKTIPDSESDLPQINMAFATVMKGIMAIVLAVQFDKKDIKTVLCNNNSIFVGFSVASGKDRAKKAVNSALRSPYLRENKIANAKNILLLVTSDAIDITIDEIGEINEYLQAEAGYNASITMAVSEDENLGKSISIAILASGFDVSE
ncbi:Cell division GTPase FtsZ [Flavobacterium fryxellicola]|nr:Cell division GTPase FtsZ [Flavobacterium fryxellicola]